MYESTLCVEVGANGAGKSTLLGLLVGELLPQEVAGAVGEVGLLMAASVLMVLPVIALFFFAQRYFIQGITFTGMKN